MHLPLKSDLRTPGLAPLNRVSKRAFDFILAVIMLPIIAPASLVLIVLARIFNGRGLFVQNRVGQYGELFPFYKICSMKPVEGFSTNVTTDNDPRITKFGRIIRKTKIDEFPQIFNVLKGDMSFVGPRPDVTEAFEDLTDKDAVILCIRPGITGVASLAFKDEEDLLASVDDPEEYNLSLIHI